MPLIDPTYLEKPATAPLPPPVDPMQEQEATPEEQALYEQFVNNAVKFISDKTNDKTLGKMLKDPRKPVAENIGRAAATVAQVIVESAKRAGTELPPEVVLNGGEEIIEVLTDNAVAMGAVKEEEAGPTAELAYLEAAKAYGEQTLRGPGAKELSQRAQNFWLEQVAREADQGIGGLGQQEAQPMSPVKAGVKQAMGGAPNG